MASPENVLQRRYDVDWLRNLALLLLFLYHLGMYYVADWGWHIKSDKQSELLQNFMVMSNLWRMCLLFFVSGLTLALIEHKYSAMRLLDTRFKRLFVPLVFGMAFIIPPQVYFELVEQGKYAGSYWTYFMHYLGVFIIPDTATTSAPKGSWTWNHLWYLIYLFVYTVLFLLLRPILKSITQSQVFRQLNGIALGLGFSAILLLFWVFIRPKFPTTHDLVTDWWSHAKYLWVMLAGYVFAKRPDIWQWVIDKRRFLLVGALVCYSFVALDRNGAFPFMGEAFKNHLWVQFAYGSVIIANLWCWILFLLAYAGRYLNKPSPLLNYANEAVLPWYILHQSLIIIFAANLAGFHFPEYLEAILILSLSLATCFIVFAVIRRVKPLRFLFGLRLS